MQLNYFVLAISLHLSCAGWSQNLVLNPSFENVTLANLQCAPYTGSGPFSAAIANWINPNGASSDIFHTSLANSCYCSTASTESSSHGQQAPRTGDAYVNITTRVNEAGPILHEFREYVQGQLSSPLVVGDCYQVSFWVSLGDNCSIASNNIGVKFTAGALVGPGSTFTSLINTTPEYNHTSIITDKVNWVEITFTYIPTTAGQDHFTIGNFFDYASTTELAVAGSLPGFSTRPNAYYYVDDVSIEQIGTGSCVLPVELTSFEGAAQKDGIALEWTTLSERNSDYFTLERIDYEGGTTELAKIPAQGNSNIAVDYKHVDLTPNEGINYYQLTGVDIDGSVSHQETIAVNWKTNQIRVFPNPAQNFVTIQTGNTASKVIRLISAEGRVVRSGHTEESEWTWNLQDLPMGVYQISVESTEGSHYLRFVKNGV